MLIYPCINWYFHKLWLLQPTLTDIRVSWWFLLVIRVIDDECKFSFWYIKVSAHYVYKCRSLLDKTSRTGLKQFWVHPLLSPCVCRAGSFDVLNIIMKAAIIQGFCVNWRLHKEWHEVVWHCCCHKQVRNYSAGGYMINEKW